MSGPGRKLRLAVLISGGGTNLQAMIDRSSAGTLNAEVVVAVSDRSGAFGLERASRANIPAFHVDYKAFSNFSPAEFEKIELPVDLADLDLRQKILKNPDRTARLSRLAGLVMAEHEMVRIIEPYKPDYICLAGFMRLVTPYFIGRFNSSGQPRVINIHPALLPSFPGRNGYGDTFDYGCKWGGITVHFADEGEDTGPIICQAVYPIRAGDDVDKVRELGLQLEHEVYSQVINWLSQGFVSLRKTPSGRILVDITDPEYGEILKRWISKCF
jgi:phosphoribosylglycinamide formyltransferase-1